MKVSDLVFAFTKLQDNELNKDVFLILQNMILNTPFDIVQERSSFLLPSIKELEQTNNKFQCFRFSKLRLFPQKKNSQYRLHLLYTKK